MIPQSVLTYRALVIFLAIAIPSDILLVTLFAIGGHGYFLDGPHPIAVTTFALLHSQVSLLSVWAVLGSTRWALRLPAASVGFLSLFVFLAIVLQDDETSRFALTSLIELLGVIAVLTVVRLRSICFVRDGTGSSLGRVSRTGFQFFLGDVLVWVVVVAELIGVVQSALPIDELAAEISFSGRSLIASGLSLAITTLAALWAQFGSGQAAARMVTLVFTAASAPLLIGWLLHDEYPSLHIAVMNLHTAFVLGSFLLFNRVDGWYLRRVLAKTSEHAMNGKPRQPRAEDHPLASKQ